MRYLKTEAKEKRATRFRAPVPTQVLTAKKGSESRERLQQHLVPSQAGFRALWWQNDRSNSVPGDRWRDTLFDNDRLYHLLPSLKRYTTKKYTGREKGTEKETQKAQVRFPLCPFFFLGSSARVAVITGTRRRGGG